MGRSKKKKKGGGGGPPAPASAVGVNEKMLRQLEGMGFDTPSCRRALLLSDNNLQVALENLEIAATPPAPAPAPVPAPAAAAAAVTAAAVPTAAATVAANAPAPAAASGEVVDEGWTFRPVKPKKKKKDHSKERNWSNFVSADEMERLARYDAITASVANIGGDGGDGSPSSLPQAEIDAIAAGLGGGGSGGGGAAGTAGGDDDARMLRDQWADEKARLQAQVRRQAEQIHALTTKLAADNDIIVASLAFAGGGDAAALAAAKAPAPAPKSKAPAPAPAPAPKPKPKPAPEPEAAKAAASPPAAGDAAAREVLKRYHAQFSKQLKKYFADKARLEQRIVALTGENTDLRKKLEMGNKAVVAQLLQEQAAHQEALAAKDREIKRLKSMVKGNVGEADAAELSQLSKEALATRLFPLVACERPDQAVQITDLLKERMSKEELVKLLSDASSREDLQRKIEEFSPTQVLGERLYPLVWKQLQGGGERDPGAAAGKVTGMLLAGVEDAELRQMLTDPAALAAKVNEALTLLATQGE